MARKLIDQQFSKYSSLMMQEVQLQENNNKTLKLGEKMSMKLLNSKIYFASYERTRMVIKIIC